MWCSRYADCALNRMWCIINEMSRLPNPSLGSSPDAAAVSHTALFERVEFYPACYESRIALAPWRPGASGGLGRDTDQ